MSGDNKHLESIRHLVYEEPTAESWRELLWALDEMAEESFEVGMAYADAHLDSWPAALRCHKCSLQELLESPPRWWPLVRNLDVT